MELYFPIVLEGDLRGELIKRGCNGGLQLERWIIEHPQAVIELQQEFLMAGSRILTAPTMGANSAKLEEKGLSGLVRDCNIFLTALSMSASGTNVPVAGCLGSAGLGAGGKGLARFEELYKIYSQQSQILEEADVRLFFIDGMSSIEEARAALLAVRQVSEKPVLVSFYCDEQGRIASGADIAAALTIMQGMGAEAFGLCGSLGPTATQSLLETLRPMSEIPFVVRPEAWENAGASEPRLLSPEEFAAFAPSFSQQGAALFGGGRGVTAEYITCLADCLEDCGINVPEPEYEDFYPCATEFKPCYLPRDIQLPQSVRCDEKLGGKLRELLSSDANILRLEIADADDLKYLEQYLGELSLPLCLDCGDEELLENALKIYTGRAMYSGGLSETVLEPLQNKYGLILQ